MNSKPSVADIVTDRIIAALETGVAPWRKPWRASGVSLRFATNLISKKAYSGCNQFLLLSTGYSSPYWLTYKQAAALGGQVRKGEKGCPVIYVGRAEDKKKKAKDGKASTFTFLKYYTVFNVEQVDGLGDHVPVPVVVEPNENAPVAACEAIWAGYTDAPRVSRHPEKAFYSPVLDYIGIPDITAFDSADAYYSTLFHEGIHSTGHESRLNRDGVSLAKSEKVAFGDETYGKEELVAELGAAFLCAEAGIDNIPASAAYCASWIKVLKGDSSLIISAAAAAQKAYRYICPEPVTAEADDVEGSGE